MKNIKTVATVLLVTVAAVLAFGYAMGETQTMTQDVAVNVDGITQEPKIRQDQESDQQNVQESRIGSNLRKLTILPVNDWSVGLWTKTYSSFDQKGYKTYKNKNDYYWSDQDSKDDKTKYSSSSSSSSKNDDYGKGSKNDDYGKGYGSSSKNDDYGKGSKNDDYGKYVSSIPSSNLIYSSINTLPSYQYPSSLSGRYAFQLPAFNFQINPTSFIISDCNTHEVPYYFANQKLLFGKPKSTFNSCSFDQGSVLLNLLPNIQRMSKKNNEIFFYGPNNNYIFSSSLRKSSRKSKVFGDIDQGQYDAYFPRYNVQVNNNKLWFQGCSSEPLQFEYSSSKINFKKYFDNNKNKNYSCLNRQQQLVSNAFKYSDNLKAWGKDKKGYQFEDGYGRSLAYCEPALW